MKTLLVFGIGNRLMMDDGIGVHVVEELKKQRINPLVQYVIGETDIYYCLDQVSEDSYIIVVDAAYLGEKPGTLSIVELNMVSDIPVNKTSIHESHFLSEVRLSGKKIEGILIGIEPSEINYGINLSPDIQERFIEIVNYTSQIIEHVINNYLC
jgi:hydrogenase maturation protease